MVQTPCQVGQSVELSPYRLPCLGLSDGRHDPDQPQCLVVELHVREVGQEVDMRNFVGRGSWFVLFWRACRIVVALLPSLRLLGGRVLGGGGLAVLHVDCFRRGRSSVAAQDEQQEQDRHGPKSSHRLTRTASSARELSWRCVLVVRWWRRVAGGGRRLSTFVAFLLLLDVGNCEQGRGWGGCCCRCCCRRHGGFAKAPSQTKSME